MPQKVTDVRLSKKGLEAGGQKGKVQGGFGDTKKVLMLVGLVVVAGGVVAYQFVGGSGPAPAKANTALPAKPAPPAVSPAPVSAALEHADAPTAQPRKDGLSVDRVEGLVRTFDTYVQERQIPLKHLRVNPFQVVRTAKVEADQDQAQKQADAEAEAEARRRQILQAASELKLGAVLIAGTTRTAVIEGRLYRLGDVVEGMRVAAIQPDHVTLAYEDQTVDLRLRPETPTP
ncbi:MAG: hypothetical protein U9R68_06160 [Planctomycetota bacterium]|nr:hypothetical protein [Planctomycetota bacterium]